MIDLVFHMQSPGITHLKVMRIEVIDLHVFLGVPMYCWRLFKYNPIRQLWCVENRR